MTIVTINFPDRGLLGIHGVPAPCGRVCFHGGEVPHGAKLDAAYTVIVKHDGNSYHMHCHFGVEYFANRRKLVYYFQNEGLPQAELDVCGLPDDVSAALALLGAKCLWLAGVEECAGGVDLKWGKADKACYQAHLPIQDNLGQMVAHLNFDDHGNLHSFRVMEYLTPDHSEYYVLGNGPDKPFLMALFGEDYWNKVCVMFAMGKFQESAMIGKGNE